VIEILAEAGFEAYAVGGGVRDILIGRKVGDWDVTTKAKPDQVISLFKRVIPTGIAHGTVTVVSRKHKIEVTTFRGEAGYFDGRHPDSVVFLDSLEEDLLRRDFTVNAIAYDLQKKRLVDPFHGQKDIKNKIIRAVGNPVDRFLEDGLRPMRAIRFASTLGFEIEKNTLASISKSVNTFTKVAKERISVELSKILASKRAHRGLELLRITGLLEHVLEELVPTIGFSQNKFHKYDVYHHTLKCLEKAKGDPVLKLAVLLHDVGKPQTAAGEEGSRTFYGHEKAAASMARKAMSRLKYSKLDQDRVANLISNHMFHYEKSWTDGAVRRLVRRVGPENLKDLWEMRRTDAWGRSFGLQDALSNLEEIKRRVEKVLKEYNTFSIKDLAIDGKDVMKILKVGPGRKVGDVLEALLEKVLDNPSLNSPEDLRKLVRELD